MELMITKDLEELSEKAAAWISHYINDVLKKKDRFSLVLSGGNTPKKLYQILADRYHDRIDWSRIDFFWGDERYVPITDERNNAKMAFDTLLNKVPVKKEAIHIMRTDIDLSTAVTEYEKLLRDYCKGSQTFDLVLMGLGGDAHVLSLFPGQDTVMEKSKWVLPAVLTSLDEKRITLTAPVVNAAARVAFLVSGGDKAAAMYHVLSGAHDPSLYPAQAIQPFNGALYWWIDKAAASDIEEDEE